jgi:WD40 repeat protein
VSAGGDHTLRLWDVVGGRQIGAPLTGHTSDVSGVAFSPDGHRLASASVDHTVRLWNADTGQPIGDPLAGNSYPVWSVAFSPDGRRIVSGGIDGTVRLWPAAAAPGDLCAKLATDITHQHWQDWVSPDIGYAATCPELPTPTGKQS